MKGRASVTAPGLSDDHTLKRLGTLLSPSFTFHHTRTVSPLRKGGASLRRCRDWTDSIALARIATLPVSISKQGAGTYQRRDGAVQAIVRATSRTAP